MSLEAECRRCEGEGLSDQLTCTECHGTGWIYCNEGGVNCPFIHCYCEAAWERQEQDKMENF